MRRVLTIGVFVSALTGCGTVQNFTEGRKGHTEPYGGVRIATDRFGGDDLAALGIMFPYWLADVPLCVIGDTLTLPVTAALAGWRIGERLWYFAFFYNETGNEPPQQNVWREFWFSDGSQQPPPRAPGGIP